jgi:hypothetical protein
MTRTVADQMVETLAAAGVERTYGIVGDSLNGFTDALRRHGGIQWLHVRHEEVAAFAAGADAHVTGGLGVCAGSCGPGNLHLINGLFDCHRSRLPVVAIAAHIPSPEIGSGYFQETHSRCKAHQGTASRVRMPTIAAARVAALPDASPRAPPRGALTVVGPCDRGRRHQAKPRRGFPARAQLAQFMSFNFPGTLICAAGATILSEYQRQTRHAPARYMEHHDPHEQCARQA